MITNEECLILGEALRRQTTNRDVLTYVDHTLAMLRIDGTKKNLKIECSICIRRRRVKAEAQRRWRAKR